MRPASVVIGSVVLGAVACGGNQAGMDRGDAGVGGGDGGPVVAVCPDTSKLHSEGSASEPVSFTLASQSVVGQVRPEDEVRVVSRPGHDVDVPTTFRAFMGDLEAAERVLAVGCLPEHELAALRDMVERRRAKGA